MATEEQMRKHVLKWRESGLSKTDYAARNGMGVHKLGYWIRKLGEEVKEEGKFFSVSQSAELLEIELPGKAVLRLPLDTPAARIRSILESVGC